MAQTKTTPAKPTKPKSATPSSAKPVAPKWKSPPGRKSKKDCKRNKKKPGWCLRYLRLHGNVGLIFFTQSDFVNDAFNKPIIDSISNEADDSLPLCSAVTLRESLTNGDALTNVKDSYHRRAFLEILDDDDDDEDCLSTLKTIKAFMEKKENNRFGTKVFIEEHSWNMNSKSTPPKMDKCVVHDDIVAFINDCFDADKTPGWAEEHMEAAMCFFTEGHIPSEAVEQLGFNASVCQDPIETFSIGSD